MPLYKNRIVIKIGTATLMNEAGKWDLRNVEKLIRVIADISGMGYQVIVVSSGAIAAGADKLNLEIDEEDLGLKATAAAVGQCSILHMYDKIFEEYDKTIAQVLMSAEDARDEIGRSNLISAFDNLLQLGVIPIVNENDSVRRTEILSEGKVFGDNDMLSAIVASLTKSGKLIFLSDTDGVNLRGSRRGKQGLETKKTATALAKKAGTDCYLIMGKNPEKIYDVLEGKIEKFGE